MTARRSKIAAYVLDNSLLLLVGTAAAVVWANVDIASYEHITHPLHFAVNDIGMVFFFALATKEVFEATLPASSFLRRIQPFRFCCCWRSPMTRSGSSSLLSSIPRVACSFRRRSRSW